VSVDYPGADPAADAWDDPDVVAEPDDPACRVRLVDEPGLSAGDVVGGDVPFS
jgi:hypothetical protein